jgi:hypothetical protein
MASFGTESMERLAELCCSFVAIPLMSEVFYMVLRSICLVACCVALALAPSTNAKPSLCHLTSRFVWPSKSLWTLFRRFLLKRYSLKRHHKSHHRPPPLKMYPFQMYHFQMHLRHTRRHPLKQVPPRPPPKELPKLILAINVAGGKSNAMARRSVKGVSLLVFGR